MENNFDDLKDIWYSGNTHFLDIDEVKNRIRQLRKQKKDRMIRWYGCLSGFSFLIIFYVIYTDDLNSLSKSISEFILLFTGIYLFYHSWNSIQAYKKEYLLNSQDFLQKIKEESQNREKRRVVTGSILSSLIVTALFLYFYDNLMPSLYFLISGFAILITTILMIWIIIKPLQEKKAEKKYIQFIADVERLLRELTN